MIQLLIKGTFKNNKTRVIGSYSSSGLEYKCFLPIEEGERLDKVAGMKENRYSFNDLLELNKFKRVEIKLHADFCYAYINNYFNLNLGELKDKKINGTKLIELANKALLKELCTPKYNCLTCLISYPYNRVYVPTEKAIKSFNLRGNRS